MEHCKTIVLIRVTTEEILPPDMVALLQMAKGLNYIHSKNLVHSDIKPANILISTSTPAQLKLSDFGFAKKVNEKGNYTLSGKKGTRCWMAPEVYGTRDSKRRVITRGLKRGDLRSDIFSLGCVFYYFLTRGEHPFMDESSSDVDTVVYNISTLNPALMIKKEQQFFKLRYHFPFANFNLFVRYRTVLSIRFFIDRGHDGVVGNPNFATT